MQRTLEPVTTGCRDTPRTIGDFSQFEKHRI